MPCYEGVAEEMSRVWFFGLNGDDVAAAVMDKQRGATTLLSEKINPNLTVIHCIIHRCEEHHRAETFSHIY